MNDGQQFWSFLQQFFQNIHNTHQTVSDNIHGTCIGVKKMETLKSFQAKDKQPISCSVDLHSDDELDASSSMKTEHWAALTVRKALQSIKAKTETVNRKKNRKMEQLMQNNHSLLVRTAQWWSKSGLRKVKKWGKKQKSRIVKQFNWLLLTKTI